MQITEARPELCESFLNRLFAMLNWTLTEFTVAAQVRGQLLHFALRLPLLLFVVLSKPRIGHLALAPAASYVIKAIPAGCHSAIPTNIYAAFQGGVAIEQAASTQSLQEKGTQGFVFARRSWARGRRVRTAARRR